MKRSEINSIMQSAKAFIRTQGFFLPPFAFWETQDWQTKGTEINELVETHLGWDITDFGKGDFSKVGLLLFTLRNGYPTDQEFRSGKKYAEKIMIVDHEQLTPLHFHWFKMEDIINRGGGNLKLRLFPSSENEDLLRNGELKFSIDGCSRTISAGQVITLEPGESITLQDHCYHEFWGEGRVLVGEVSLVNDDIRDNRFFESVGRFPNIEEDVEPLYLLVNDYDKYYHPL